MTAFARFPPRLQEAIVSRLGWTSLRPVQELAGEAILDGKNAVVLAPTAGGKTEASMFPALRESRELANPTAWASSTSPPSRRSSTTRKSASAPTPRWSGCGASSGTATWRSAPSASSWTSPPRS